MIVDIGIETFIKIMEYDFGNKSRNLKFIDEIIETTHNLKNYYNENIRKICKFYKCIYPGINEHLNYYNNYETYLRENNN